MKKCRLLFSATFLSLFLSFLTVPVSALNSQESAVFAIFEAERLVAEAYEAVLDAERVGSNVSVLLVELNFAVGLLSEARRALDVDNFDEAVRLAELSREAVGDVEGEARMLRVKASDARVNRLWWSLVISGLGISSVVATGWLGYRFFKVRYFRRLLKKRPRIGEE